MTCLRCVCQSALLVLVIASPPKCSSGLSCRAQEKLPKTGETSLLKTAAMDRVVSQKGSAPRPKTGRIFYILAHMILEPYLADWAMTTGANCLEIDIAFTHKDQDSGAGARPLYAYHGPMCDAGCPNLWVIELFVWSGFGGGGFPLDCEAESKIADLLDHIVVSQTDVRLLHLDDKNGGNFIGKKGYEGFKRTADQTNTGQNLAKMIVDRVWEKGYKGEAIVFGGSANLHPVPCFFVGVVQKMAQTSWLAESWLAWEVLYNQGTFSLGDFVAANNRLKAALTLLERGFKTVRCDGITGCFHSLLAIHYHIEAAEAVSERESGKLDYVTVWTVDFPHDMRIYLETGVDSAITNAPSIFVSVAKDANRLTPYAR